jgi:prepilin-type N-terminal cleavage/methylation domain-containing protein
MKNKSLRGRDGFTLIEVLVTLILLAVLAAAVFPVVTKQSDDADPVRVAGDLASVRAGVEAFRLDMRPDYPLLLTDLVTEPASGADALDGADYAGIDADKWKGPYLDVSETPIETGFGGQIADRLVCLGEADAIASASCAEGNVVAVKVLQVDSTENKTLEMAIDGTDATIDATGKLRRFINGAGADTVYYVVGPFF